MKNELIVIADYSAYSTLNSVEICTICKISETVLYELIAHDIIHPQGNSPEEWSFDLIELRRAKKALRLKHDLEITFTAVALVMDLLDEMENMRKRMDLMQKYF